MDSTDLLTGFVVNLVVAWIIVRFIYYPVKQDKNFVFTYLAFNTIIYFVVSFLTTSEMGVGVGFGLFAIFSVLRYRTFTMSAREMTYLFIVIALPVMNSITMGEDNWELLLAVNAAVIVILFVLEQEWGFHFESSKLIKYERIELVKPEHRALLLDDLRSRTGLPINRVEVGPINFLNDSALLKVYFDEPKSQRWSGTDINADDDD